MRTVKEPLGQLQAYQHSHHGGAGRRREKGIANLFEHVTMENFPHLKKKIDIQV